MDHVQQAGELFHKRAAHYDKKYSDVSLYHDVLAFFCSAITEQNASILEIACGPGNVTRYLLQQRPDFRLLGIDLAPAMVELSAQYHPAAEFRVMDCRDIRQLPGGYDGIMCSFCLPYLDKKEAVQLIADAAALLKKGGILYISTIEDEYRKSGIQYSSLGDAVFMYYHEAVYLEQALRDNQLEIILSRRQDFRPEDGSVMTDLILIARK